MSVRTISVVWEHSQHSGTELLMMLALADFSDDHGNSYPAVATLAEKCRMKPRNANYILSALQASGELEVLPNEGPKGVNRYRIAIERLRGVPAAVPAVPAEPRGVSFLETNPPAAPPKAKRPRAVRTALPDSFGVSARVREWAAARGFDSSLDAHLEHFIGYAKARGALYADWDAAFENAIRDDWAGLRGKSSRVATSTRQHELSADEVFQ